MLTAARSLERPAVAVILLTRLERTGAIRSDLPCGDHLVMSTANAAALVRQSAQTRQDLVGRSHNRPTACESSVSSETGPIFRARAWRAGRDDEVGLESLQLDEHGRQP